MLSRQCELVHRRYTADQERLLYHLSTRFAGGTAGSERVFPKPHPTSGAVRGKTPQG